MEDLEAIDAQVAALEAQLQEAKAKREEEARQRTLEVRKQTEAEELQRQIDALEAQLRNDVAPNQLVKEDRPPSRPSRQQSAETRTASSSSAPNISSPGQAAFQASPTATSSPPIRSSLTSSEPSVPVMGASEQAKRAHQWSKPSWALPSDALPDDEIQKDSIVNPLLKSPNKGGYERKVKPKDLELIRGNFVAPKANVPDPRLVWIVVNVDGCKLGKIVMHLHGKRIDDIVDIFGDLKGLELKKRGNTLLVDDIDPSFTIVSGKSGNGCFGIIQEGRDIFDEIMALPAESVLTVKQSHIYPVKKAKRSV